MIDDLILPKTCNLPFYTQATEDSVADYGPLKRHEFIKAMLDVRASESHISVLC